METAKVYHQYPVEYEEWITLKDGSVLFLRPIKPTDGPLILDFFQKLSPETIYFRFLTHLDRLQPEFLKHLVEIDYETHFTLVLSSMRRERNPLSVPAVKSPRRRWITRSLPLF